MKSLKVKEWGGYEFFFDPKEVSKAQTPGEVLECLKDYRGVSPYSPMRCRVLAETPDGKKLIKEIGRLCEEGTDKGKGKKEVRKAAVAQD